MTTSQSLHVVIPPEANAPRQTNAPPGDGQQAADHHRDDVDAPPQHAASNPALPISPAQERDVDAQALRLRDTRPEFTLPANRLSSNILQSPPSSIAKHDDEEDPFSGTTEFHERYGTNNQALLPPPGEVPSAGSNRRRPQRTGTYFSRRSEVEWAEKYQQHTVGERLKTTIEEAEAARNKAALQAKWSGWILNAAIGLQVLLGSLTTGLSAVATTGKSAAVNTTILGGLSTLVASYLARARGSGEPEASNARVTALNSFLRRVENFTADYGHLVTADADKTRRIEDFRKELEYLLNGSGDSGEGRPVPSQISRSPA